MRLKEIYTIKGYMHEKRHLLTEEIGQYYVLQLRNQGTGIVLIMSGTDIVKHKCVLLLIQSLPKYPHN